MGGVWFQSAIPTEHRLLLGVSRRRLVLVEVCVGSALCGKQVSNSSGREEFDCLQGTMPEGFTGYDICG